MAKSSLVNKLIPNLYGGMSQQESEKRFDNQVDYMDNCIPTLGEGTQRRNPLVRISDTNVAIDDDAFIHSYSTGLISSEQTSYAITLDATNGIRIFDAKLGTEYTVYVDASVIVAGAENYLMPFTNKSRYVAQTVGDTTILVNRDVTVLRDLSIQDIGTGQFYSQITLDSCLLINGCSFTRYVDDKAPFSWSYDSESGVYSHVPAVITFTVDGYNISYQTKYTVRQWLTLGGGVESITDWLINLKNAIYDILPSSKYTVELLDGDIIIKKLQEFSGETPLVFVIDDIAVTYGAGIRNDIDDNPDHYLKSNVEELIAVTNPLSKEAWEQTAYIIIEDYDFTNPYTYKITIADVPIEVTGLTGGSASTVEIAKQFVTAINADPTLSALVDSVTSTIVSSNQDTNIVKIVMNTGQSSKIEYQDTFGNHAGYAFNRDISAITDLPLKFGHDNSVVRVIGNKREEGDDYWVYYDGNSWVETVSPESSNTMSKRTLPFQIRREADYFVVDTIDFKDRLVGDDETNKFPSFVDNTINDLFVFKNRLAFVSKGNIVFSQTDGLFNFFRTTVQSLRDDDRIDVSINTSKYVDIKYAVPLDDFVMLFSDTQQFRLEYQGALTASTLSAKLATSYHLNTAVRPLLVDNRIYFIVNNNEDSFLMEYFHHYTSSSKVLATNITSHLPRFLPSDIDYMEANIINNQLFVKSKSNSREVAVYNYAFNGQDRLQSAWHIWSFSADVKSMFSEGDRLYMFLDSYGLVSSVDWAITDAKWNDNEIWRDEGFWDEGLTAPAPEYAYMDLKPYSDNGITLYRDFGDIPFRSTIILSTWVYNPSGLYNARANLLFKNVQVDATSASSVNMLLYNFSSNKIRVLDTERVIGKRVMSTGKSSQVKIQLESKDDEPFQIESISYEGSVSSRSTQIK